MALVAGALLLVTQLTGSSGTAPTDPGVPGFLARALGQAEPSAALVRRPARGVVVDIARGGYAVERAGQELRLQTASAGGAWTRFEDGVTRSTPFGAETITVGPTTTEQFLTVEKRQGRRTWRWRLDTGSLEPRLSVGGRVELLAGKANSGLSIAPAAILDADGRTITPGGTRWRLERKGKSWWLALDLDDTRLPLPYVIDPAANYPSPLRLRSTASGSLPNSWVLNSGTGGANTATSTQPGQNATGYYRFNPGQANTTATAPGGAGGRGWVIDPAGGATGFPAGTWSFTIVTDIAGGTLVTGTAIAAVGIWKGPLAGPWTAVQAVTDDPAAQNLRTQLTPKTTTVSFSLPKFTIVAGQTLYIEVWRRQTGGINSGTASNRRLTLQVNDASSFVAHPAADDTAPTPALSITAPNGAYLTGTTLYYRGSNAGSFAFRNAIADAGSGAFQSTHPAIATAGWTHNAENVTAGPNFQSSTYSWSASPSNPALHTVVSEDNAMQTASTGVTFVNDSTAPVNNGSLALTGLVGTGSLYSASTNLSLTFATGTDAGSGIATTGQLLRRAEANLTSSDGKANGTCAAFGAFATVATDPVSPYTDNAGGGIQTGKCYRYEYVVSENVGNTRTYTSGDVKVDTTAPAAPTLTLAEVTGTTFQHVSGTELFYNTSGSNSGSFTVDSTDATTNDGQSGIVNVEFPTLPAGFAGGGLDTTPTPYRGSYSWNNTATTSPGSRTVTGTNNATGNVTATFTVTRDVTAPTGQAVALVGGPWYTSTSVSLSPTDGTDAGAGVDTASRVYEKEEATLAGGVCGGFGGTWTVVANPDATVQTGNCYRYRLTITDNVGNASAPSAVSAAAMVDTSAAAAPALSFGTFTNASATGSTVYVRTGVAGGFTVTGTSADAQSGVASLAFPALGAGWSGGGADASGPYEGVYTYTPAASAPGGQDVTARNGAGTDSAPTSFTVVADTTAPTSSAQCDGGSCAPWFTSSPVSVALAASDGGSGLQELRYTADGSDPTPLSTLYVAPLSVAATTTVKFRGYDRVGNVEAVASVTVQVDTTQPSVPALALGESDPESFVSGTTLYYNPGGSNSGTFTVDATSSDAESGIERIQFPAIAGTTGGGDDLASPYGATYDWTSATSASGAATVTARNGASLTRTADFTFAPDTTAPAGHSLAVSGGAGWITGASVTLLPTDGSDAGAGVDTGSRVYERDQATLASGSCGSWDATWTTVSNPDASVQSGFCYRYRLKLSDNVANQSAPSAASGTVLVDTSAPAAPSLAFGSLTAAHETAATVYYRPGAASSSFTVTAATADAQSGVASFTFPAAAPGWSASGTGSSRTYDHSGSPSDPADPNDVTATNGAGLVSAAGQYTVTPDASAPTGMSATVTAGYAAGLSVPVTLADGTDTGSGVDTASRVVERDEAPLDNGDGTCDAFPGSWTTVTLSGGNDTTLASGTCYRYRLRIGDRVGNEAVSGASATVKVDTTDPTGAVTAPAAGSSVRGAAVTVSSDSADTGAGVASARFQRSPAGAGTWTDVDTDAGSAPWSVTWDTTAVADGLYDLRVLTTDGVGRTATSAVAANVRVDNSDPSSSATFPAAAGAYNASGWDAGCATAGLCGTASDGGSGIDSVELSIRRGSGNYWNGSAFASASEVFVDASGTTSWSYGFAASSFPADDSYTVRVRAVDVAGNVESASSRTFDIDGVAPDTTIDSQPADPTSATGASFTFSATEGGSTFECRLDSGSWGACASPEAYGSLADGSHTFRVRATDDAANTDATPASFTWLVDTTAPSAPTLSFGAFTNAAAGSGEVFYRPGAASGGFAVTASSTDAESGVSGYGFPALAGWSRAVVGDTASYSHSGSPSDPAEPNDVTATSASGVTSAPTSFPVTPDSTPPAGMSVTVSAGFVTALSVPVTLANGSDTGSGVDAASRVVERDEAPLDNGDGTCDAFPGSWSTVVLSGGDDTTVATGTCYRYRLRIADRVGNEAASGPSATVKVDTSAPAAPALAFSAFANASASGSTVWFRPGVAGGFTLGVTAADAQSGVAATTHPNLGAGWSRSGDDYSFTAGAVDPGEPNDVTVTNGAGLTSAATSFTVSADPTAPTGGSVAYPDGYDADGTVTITTGNGTDPDSGIDASSAVLERQTATLTANTCGSYGPWTTVTSPDTIPTGDCARYRLRVSDRVGNEATTTSTDAVKVDTAGSTAALDDPGANLRGTVALGATADDASSGVDSVAFQRSPAGAGTWTAIGSDPTSPYTASLDTVPLADGLYDLRVLVTDNAGNTTTSAVVGNRLVDNTPPTITMNDPGADLSGTVALTATANDSGSGANAPTFEFKPAAGSTWTPTPAAWNTTVLGDGLYDLRATVTDAAGNTATSAPVTDRRVDNHAPDVSVTAPGQYVNAAAADPFAVTATSPDTDLAQVEFFRCDTTSPGCAAGNWVSLGVDASAPFSADWPVDADGNRALRAVARDLAGNPGSNVVDTLVDRTAPTGGSVGYADGYDADGTLTITTGDGTDGGSGVDAGSALIDRQTATLAAGACGSWSAWNAVTSPDTVATGLCTRYRLRVSDLAGNEATFTSADVVEVDTTPPASPTLSFSALAAAVDSGSTLYYRPGGGSFTLTAAAVDPESGVTGYVFPALGTGWTDSGSGAAHDYAFAGTPAEPGAGQTVTATNAAGLDAVTTFTVTADTTPPAGASVAYTDGYRTSLAVAFALAEGTDAGSGLDAAATELRRASAPLADGACDTFGSATGIATAPAAAYSDVTVASGLCYRYELSVRDALGNETVVASGAAAKVDAQAPTGAVDDPGANLRGTVALTATAADTGGAGVASVQFQRSPAGGGPWTTIDTNTTAPYAASFDTTAAADGLYDLQVLVTDRAGSTTASAPVTGRRVDNTPPAVSLDDPGSHLRAMVSLNAVASDAGSGLASTLFERAPAGSGSWTPITTSWDTTSVADGFYDLRATATDNAGNQAVSAVLGREVDNTPPQTSIDAGPPGLDSDITPTFAFSSNESPDVTFACSVDGGAFASCASPATLGSLADGGHTFEVRTTDLAGNVAATPASSGWTVDATDPTVSLTFPAPGALVAGVVTLTASATDASGAPTLEFAISEAGTGDWTTSSSAWDTTAVADGRYDVRVVATDPAGNSATATALDVLVDNTAPLVAIDSPAGAYINAASPDPFGLAATASDSGAGVASVEFLRRLVAGTPCASPNPDWSSIGLDLGDPFAADWALPADGEYVLCALARDAAGHAGTAAATVTVDRTDPDALIDAVAPFVRGTIALSSPSTDATSGVGQVDFQRSPSGASTWTLVGTATGSPYDGSLDTTALADGDYDLRAFVTDRAGNAAASASVATRVDNTPPTGSVTGPAASTNLRLTVPVTSDSADGGSGVDSVQFQTSPTGADTWTNLDAADTGAPYGVDWDTTTYADGLYDLRAVTTDRAGNTFTSTLVTGVRIDNTKPTGAITDPGAYLRGTVPLAGAAADEGSGVATVEFQRSPAGAGTWTSISTDTDQPYEAGLDTAALADGPYDLRVLVTDNAGNQETAQIANRLVDNTKPTASLADPGGALNSGVTLTAAAADTGSGVASVEFQRAPAGSGSWTTLATDTSDPYTAPFDTTTVADGLYDLRAIVTDSAGNQETAGVGNRRVDNTAPTTTASGVPTGPTPGPITITLAASDGGVGVAQTRYRIDGGALQTYSGGITLGGSDGAYTIQYFSIDALGNVESTHSFEVVIDNTAPGAGPGDPGRYLRGIVTLTAAPADASGITFVEFQFSPAGTAAWAPIGSILGAGPYEATWNTATVADGPYDLQVVVTDGAGNVTAAALPDLPKIVDNTSPAGAVTSPAEGALRSGTFTITATASDAPADGSVAAVEFQVRASGGSWATVATDTASPYAATWNSAGSPDGAAELRVVVSDVAGNDPFTSAVRTITLDNNAPSVALSAPGAASGIVALTASGSGDIDTVVFEKRTGGGAWTSIGSDTTPGDGFGVSFDTGGLADGTHELRARAIDVSGNEGTSSAQSISVDNTAPTASMTQPAAGATVGGPAVGLGANAADGTSGVATVTYQFGPAGGGAWADGSGSSSAPWGAAWNASAVADGQYELRARVADAAGNIGLSAPISVTVDSTAPTVALGPVAATLSGTVTLTATVTGTGVDSVTFERRPGGGSWAAIGSDSSAPYSLAFNTASVGDGVYDIRAVVRDDVGNSSEDARAGVRIDNSAPSLVRSEPEDGETVTAVAKIELTASEPLGGVDATVDGKAVTVAIDGAQATITGTLEAGAHVVTGELRDLGGRSAPFRVSFTVRPEGDGDGATWVERNVLPGTTGTLTSADGAATVTVPAGAFTAGAGDWMIIRIETTPARGNVGGGLASSTPVWDVTARMVKSGLPVHSFSSPLEIVLPTGSPDVVPATFEGSWRPLRRIARGSSLTADLRDGFWVEGGSVHILTRHLTLFAVLADDEPPQPPQDLAGTVATDGLTLRWRAGADNSGLVDEVVLFVNGVRYASFDAAATQTKLGAFAADDSRVFTWRERDAAGNVSAETPRLRALPRLAGKTLAEAQRELAARGFRIGAVSEKPSSAAPGTVIESAGIALDVEGTAIPLVVAAGARGETKFVFSAVGTKRLDRTKRGYVGVRIKSSRSAVVRATLVGSTGRRISTWRVKARAGASIVRLRLPRTVRRPATYRIAFVATAGGQTVRRTIRVRFLRPTETRTPARGTVDVVLTGAPAARRPLVAKLRGGGTRPLRTGTDGAYDLTAAARRNVDVIVVDVDRLGLSLVRGLRTVFPLVRIVALTNNRQLLARAVRSGATVARPRSTSDTQLARLVRRLAARR